jgi:hypothetical protein
VVVEARDLEHLGLGQAEAIGQCAEVGRAKGVVLVVQPVQVFEQQVAAQWLLRGEEGVDDV